MRLYTRGGDEGETGLFGGVRVPKGHPRLEAYGSLDELNAWLGWCAVACEGLGAPAAKLTQRLRREQDRLFVAGSLLATPPEAPESARARLPQWPEESVEELERELDAWTITLPELGGFILPGGGEAGARLHLARTVCRRAERAVAALAADPANEVDPRVLAWLNRLSDWLFQAARAANAADGREDVPWRPVP